MLNDVLKFTKLKLKFPFAPIWLFKPFFRGISNHCFVISFGYEKEGQNLHNFLFQKAVSVLNIKLKTFNKSSKIIIVRAVIYYYNNKHSKMLKMQFVVSKMFNFIKMFFPKLIENVKLNLMRKYSRSNQRLSEI